jgi:hypothetical protein
MSREEILLDGRIGQSINFLLPQPPFSCYLSMVVGYITTYSPFFHLKKKPNKQTKNNQNNQQQQQNK